MIKNIDELFNELLGDFNPNQVRVLGGRFGFKTGERVTLQEIGDELGITRERVRQIEEASLKKLKPKVEERLGDFLDFSHKHLVGVGGVKRDDQFINDLKQYLKETANAKHFDQKIKFLFLVAEKPFYEKESDDFHAFWYSDEKAKSKFSEFIGGITNFFKTGDKKDILENKTHLKEYKDLVHLHFMEIPKYFGTNVFGDFGLREWPEIEPKAVRDKIYLVLKRYGKPLHFQDIAKYVTKYGISKKPVHPQTSHNELINDDRFVLVGRGIYGLREHGYEPGTVKEVVAKLLKKNGPMTAKEIVKHLTSERFFRENTILINLQNKDYFKKLKDGRYQTLK